MAKKQTKNQLMGDMFTNFLRDTAMEDLMDRGLDGDVVEDWSLKELAALDPTKIVADKAFQKVMVSLVTEFIGACQYVKEESEEDNDR